MSPNCLEDGSGIVAAFGKAPSRQDVGEKPASANEWLHLTCIAPPIFSLYVRGSPYPVSWAPDHAVSCHIPAHVLLQIRASRTLLLRWPARFIR